MWHRVEDTSRVIMATSLLLATQTPTTTKLNCETTQQTTPPLSPSKKPYQIKPGHPRALETLLPLTTISLQSRAACVTTNHTHGTREQRRHAVAAAAAHTAQPKSSTDSNPIPTLSIIHTQARFQASTRTTASSQSPPHPTTQSGVCYHRRRCGQQHRPRCCPGAASRRWRRLENSRAHLSQSFQ